MKRYIMTIKFEINDVDCQIEQSIIEKGLEHVQEQTALGFTDPDFENITCTVQDKTDKIVFK